MTSYVCWAGFFATPGLLRVLFRHLTLLAITESERELTTWFLCQKKVFQFSVILTATSVPPLPVVPKVRVSCNENPLPLAVTLRTPPQLPNSNKVHINRSNSSPESSSEADAEAECRRTQSQQYQTVLATVDPRVKIHPALYSSVLSRL